jgi:hypothetical protein
MQQPSKSSSHGTTFKEKVETVQAIVTIAAILVGGLWTYRIFIEERHEYPHANVEQKLSHVVLSKRAKLLRVGIELSNTGSAKMMIGKATIWVQQILPMLSCPKDGVCVADETNDAIKNIKRKNDHFGWPLIAERNGNVEYSIEPGEKQLLEFEFIVPPEVKVARVYSYFRNEKLKEGGEIGWFASSWVARVYSYFRNEGDETGWFASSYYDFRTPNNERGTK